MDHWRTFTSSTMNTGREMPQMQCLTSRSRFDEQKLLQKYMFMLSRTKQHGAMRQTWLWNVEVWNGKILTLEEWNGEMTLSI